MRLLACGLSLVLALPVGLAAPSKTTGNLLANGSFEEGPEEVGDFKSLDKGASDIRGWRVTRGQIDLIGTMHLRAHDLRFQHPTRWVVVQATDIEIPVLRDPNADDMGVESVIPDDLWSNVPLPNTIAPSFVTCNMERSYELELKVGLSWGKSPKSSLLSTRKDPPPQTIYLPLHFSKVQVYSAITPPSELVDSIQQHGNKPSPATMTRPPRLPPRRNTAQGAMSGTAPQTPVQPAPSDPLYPPQLGPQNAPAYDDAPPSYDEAMADQAAGPFDGLRPRPAFSGETNENAPSQMPEKS